ncbi:STAS domain-containing protein [Pseudalkalibacillus caeni]|uniref:STAS domain-containing protein n=1 Tax=Exobacillus caeni TaxID=2574798 RepID=A0A5R9F7N1_9BACL|nr:STAS domain-containing protein [Pseudalkalibacillus caeni]TLS36853.1 STAS domain-containing protein [Pseudalkalibacillus caeni]
MGDFTVIEKEVERVKNKIIKKVVVSRTEAQKENLFLKNMFAAFLSLSSESFRASNELIEKRFTDWAVDNAHRAIECGLTLERILEQLDKCNEAFWEATSDVVIEQNISRDKYIKRALYVGSMLNNGIHSFTLAYSNLYQKKQLNGKKITLKMSDLILPITEKAGVLPLVLDLNTQQICIPLKEIMEKVLHERLQMLIIDLSGIQKINAGTVNELNKMIASLSILGVNIMLTGIQPATAQSMLKLEKNFSDVTVHSTLKQAVQHILV